MRLFSQTPGLYHVAVTEHAGRRRPRLRAYVQWYHPDLRACMHHVHALSTGEAKRLAMAEHRRVCMGGKA